MCTSLCVICRIFWARPLNSSLPGWGWCLRGSWKTTNVTRNTENRALHQYLLIKEIVLFYLLLNMLSFIQLYDSPQYLHVSVCMSAYVFSVFKCTRISGALRDPQKFQPLRGACQLRSQIFSLRSNFFVTHTYCLFSLDYK